MSRSLTVEEVAALSRIKVLGRGTGRITTMADLLMPKNKAQFQKAASKFKNNPKLKPKQFQTYGPALDRLWTEIIKSK